MPNHINLCFMLFLLCPPASVSAQSPDQPHMDSPQMLQWVERQAGRIDSLISDAMRGSEPVEIFVRLTDCYQVFDAICMAGLYCTDVRIAAEAGRKQCDVINYRLEKDLNSKLQRAVEARRQATLMKEAAKICRQQSGAPAQVFTPNDLIRHDAHIAELDILDGMATEDLHIMSQKLEWAIQTLYDLEHLARSLTDCQTVLSAAERAVLDCQAALAAPNWQVAHRSIKSALANVQLIQQAAPCQ